MANLAAAPGVMLKALVVAEVRIPSVALAGKPCDLVDEPPRGDEPEGLLCVQPDRVPGPRWSVCPSRWPSFTVEASA